MKRQIVVALALIAGHSLIAVAEGNKACALASPAEIESVLGAKVTGLNSPGTGDSSAQICMGNSSKGSVMLRLAKRRNEGAGSAGEAERKGLEIAKKMGAQVDLKTFGPVTCSTIIPPKSLEEHGFNTTCAISKPPQVAAIEIKTKTRADMVPIEKLHPLAEKIAGRF